MTVTAITGPRATAGTQAINQAGRRPDRAVMVEQLEPNSAPLLRLTKGNKMSKRVTINPEFDWWEDEPFPYWDAIDDVAGYSDSDTALTVDNGGYFASNKLVLVPRTGEIFLVTSVSGDVLTVVRGAAGTTALKAALLNNDDLRIIGTAYAEGTGAGTMKSTQKVKVNNYTQIFKDTFGATGTEEASEMYWGNDRKQEREEQGIDHAIAIESAFLFGSKSEDTSGVTARRTTGGVISFITSNVTAINGYLSLDLLDQVVLVGTRFNSKMSDRGGKLKWAFASRVACGAINTFGRDVLRTVPKDQMFGIATQEYKNIHGRILLIEHNLLENNPLTAGLQTNVFGGYMILVDPASPKYRFMRGRDTKLERNIHANDTDGWQDQYKTEAGLQFVHERFNSLATGIIG